jgi:hypothetical protein
MVDTCRRRDSCRAISCSQMFPDKCQLLRLLHDWQESVPMYPVDLKLRRTEIPLITREFRLVLKVLLSDIRTDTESGGEADARQGT